MPEYYIANSKPTMESYIKQCWAWYDEFKYLTFDKPRIGPDRSLDQNSLFYVWLTEFAAFLTQCHKKEVTKGMIEGIKRTMKKGYWKETGAPWMVQTVRCPLTGNEKKDFTSSADWKRGEMFDFLTWLQSFAADKGCILESKGEYAKLQREQNA